jgi:hypothetical protein
MFGTHKKTIVSKGNWRMHTLKPRSVCDTERDRRNNIYPLDEESLD